MAQVFARHNHTPQRLTAENIAVSVPAAGTTTLLDMVVEGVEKLSIQIDNTVQALDAFTITGKVHRDATAYTIASTAVDYSAPSGRLLNVSGALVTLAAGSSGRLDVDVSGLYEVIITTSAAVDSAVVSIFAQGTTGGQASPNIGGSTGGAAGGIKTGVYASTPAIYRNAVIAADVMAAPGTVTCTKLTGVGSASTGTYTIFVVAGNSYGRTTATQGNTTVATETTNLGIRAAFAAVTGATFYDIYCSTGGAASAFVGRITETQRGTGIILTAVNVTGAGGTAGAVDIYVPGTGLAVNGGQLTQNNAYIIPNAIVDCSGCQYVDFDLNLTRTGDIVAPSLKVIPFFLDSRTSTYFGGEVQTLNFGGPSGAYWPMNQRLRIEARGNSGVALVVAAIAGTGASLAIDATLS